MLTVDTAQDAIETAVAFLERYWTPVRPLRAEHKHRRLIAEDKPRWIVHCEVGSIRIRSVTVEIHADSGKVVGYTVDEQIQPLPKL